MRGLIYITGDLRSGLPDYCSSTLGARRWCGEEHVPRDQRLQQLADPTVAVSTSETRRLLGHQIGKQQEALKLANGSTPRALGSTSLPRGTRHALARCDHIGLWRSSSSRLARTIRMSCAVLGGRVDKIPHGWQRQMDDQVHKFLPAPGCLRTSAQARRTVSGLQQRKPEIHQDQC